MDPKDKGTWESLGEDNVLGFGTGNNVSKRCEEDVETTYNKDKGSIYTTSAYNE
jgi:hypothetical protein